MEGSLINATLTVQSQLAFMVSMGVPSQPEQSKGTAILIPGMLCM